MWTDLGLLGLPDCTAAAAAAAAPAAAGMQLWFADTHMQLWVADTHMQLWFADTHMQLWVADTHMRSGAHCTCCLLLAAETLSQASGSRLHFFCMLNRTALLPTGTASRAGSLLRTASWSLHLGARHCVACTGLQS